jgi:hypothetical protein
MSTVPCRLYLILASEAPVGVIFRRGPSNKVQIIRWNTADDTFEPGHWFKGRIYERRSDLTPDGTKLVYFASKQQLYAKKEKIGEDFFANWTAISKPPYLTALALWPAGETYHGGGLFADNQTLHLNHFYCREPFKDIPVPKQLKVKITGSLEVLEDGIMDQRMKRDGWRFVQNATGSHWTGQGRVYDQPVILRKWSHNGKYALIYRHLGSSSVGEDGWYKVEYGLWHDETKTELPVTGAIWADWDQKGRLVFAREGKIFAASRPDFKERELADFNDNQFKPFPPPEWATHW